MMLALCSASALRSATHADVALYAVRRPRSVLLQPITEVRNPSRCNAVLVAVDKVTADYCSDFFYEELFTQSDW